MAIAKTVRHEGAIGAPRGVARVANAEGLHVLAGREEIGEALLHLAAGNAEPRAGLEQDRHLVVRLTLVRNAGEVERTDRLGQLAALDKRLGQESVRKGKEARRRGPLWRRLPSRRSPRRSVAMARNEAWAKAKADPRLRARSSQSV